MPGSFSRIRTARPDDADNVAGMCAALGLAEGRAAPPAFDAATFRRDGFGTDRGFYCLVAELHGQTVGYALFCPDYDTDRLRHSVYLADLYVVEASRGRGVGSALVHAVAGAGHDAGARMMFWSVLKSNATARRFYRRFGKEMAGQVECFAGDADFERLAQAPVTTRGIGIQRATVSDSGVLADYLCRMLEEIGEQPPADAGAILNRDMAGRPDAFTAIIARRAGQPLGFALYWPTYDTETGGRGAWLSDLFVIPEARGSGVARDLMGEVARRAAARGGRFLTWLVHAHNARARKFYRKVAREEPDDLPCVCEPGQFAALVSMR